ncbi:hypothetical protein Ancab_010570 [Ancistrocladus abbreviatus]
MEAEKATVSGPSSPGVSPVHPSDCMEQLLKFVLESSLNGTLGGLHDIGLSKDFIFGLLKDDDDSIDLHSPSTVDTSEGIPAYPLYKHLALALEKCIASGSFSWTCKEVPLICEDDSLKQAKDGWNKLILDKGFVLTNMLKSVNFELHVQEPFFSQLKDGVKTVEGRCALVDYNRIVSGALVLFNKCLILEVQDVHCYASFAKMLEAETLEKVLPGVLTIPEGVQIYRKFYTEEKERVNGVRAICLQRPAPQPYTALADIISGLGYEGIQSLLGLKSTAGTISDALPPPRSTLVSSFMLPHKPNGCTLTDGARALAKHSHRGSSNYWGKLEGNDLDKNRLALEVIWHIIAHSCWLNIHVVKPHGAVFEIRVPEGYGARWSKDGTKFIGFLEPYMEDGHSKKWRH